jgi:hypothetical protein
MGFHHRNMGKEKGLQDCGSGSVQGSKKFHRDREKLRFARVNSLEITQSLWATSFDRGNRRWCGFSPFFLAGIVLAVILGCGGNSGTGANTLLQSGTGASSGGSGGGSDVPTLVQHVSESNTQGNAVSAYIIRLPNTTEGGNCLIVGVNSQFSGVPPTITVSDDKGDAYNEIISHSDGIQTVSLFAALSVTRGAQNISVNFSSATSNVAAVASEFYNVAAANAVDGSSANSGNGASITAGSFLPTTSGDLIYQFAIEDSASSPIGFDQGSNPWALLSADLMDKMTAQYEVQTTASTINPSMSMKVANPWNSVAIALKAAPSGSGISSIHVVHLEHNALPANTGTSAPLQFPCTGNLVVVSWIGTPGYDLTGINDNQTNSYFPIGSVVSFALSGDNQMFYAANAKTSTTMTGPNLTMNNGPDTAGSTALLFDITGAASSPFDSTAMATGNQSTFGDVTAVSITPITPDGLVISSIGVDSNTIVGLSPGNFLSSVTTPEAGSGGWPDDENNGWALAYNSTAGELTFVWNTTGGPVNNWASVAAAFKSAGH